MDNRIERHRGIVAGAVGLGLALGASAGPAVPLTIGQAQERPDRLLVISGERDEELLTEYSTDGGNTWNPATVYIGTTIDEWRTCAVDAWNQAAVAGRIPSGAQACAWNYFVDVAASSGKARLRFVEPRGGRVRLEREVDLPGPRDVFVIDHRNVVRFAGGALPSPWKLMQPGKKLPSVASITCPVDDPLAPPLVLKPGLSGWHRIFIGLEPYLPCQVSLSKEAVWYAIPDLHRPPRERGGGKLLRDYYLTSADLTDQDISLALGGTVPTWHDASVRYLRFVPMTAEEIADFSAVRRLAESSGRPFAGYVEQCTAGHYAPGALTLREHTRNEMRLNKRRGATDVYVHVIRAGSKAWYHSDIVEHCTPQPGEAADGWVRFGKWMAQGDPMAVAVQEARAVGLKVFPDMGMNVTYITKDPHYKGLADRISREHPEYLVPGHTMFLDYRKEGVRAYVANIARELMTTYDVDGINLDFARFGCNKAFDEESLIDVMRRIHEARLEVESAKGRRLVMAARIPSYRYSTDAAWSQAIYGGEHPWFTAALRTWAKNGWLDRVMVCCPIPQRFATLSLERYTAAIAGTGVELWGDLYGGGSRPRSLFVDAARNWIREGLNGGFFFYSVSRATEFEQINWLLRLVDNPTTTAEPHLSTGR